MCELGAKPFDNQSHHQAIRLVPKPTNGRVTAQDSLISFDGPLAGRAANAFVTIYQNSNDAFRTAILALTQRQGGIFPIHTGRMSGTVGGYNYAANDAFGLSGAYINDLVSDPWSLLHVIYHEIAHDLHDDASNLGVLDGLTRDTGQVHSREQSAFIMGGMAELVARGIIEARHIDAIDYANDVALIDLFRPTSDKVIDGNYNSIQPEALQTLQKQIVTVLTEINNGNHQVAAQILTSLPPDATLSLTTRDPQYDTPRPPVEYNVRELILQHCLLGFNVERFYGRDHSGLTALKQEMPQFIATLNAQDLTFMQTLENAAHALYLPLRHLPVAGNENPVLDPMAPRSPAQSYGPYSPATSSSVCSQNPNLPGSIGPSGSVQTCKEPPANWKALFKHWQSVSVLGGSAVLAAVLGAAAMRASMRTTR